MASAASDAKAAPAAAAPLATAPGASALLPNGGLYPVPLTREQLQSHEQLQAVIAAQFQLLHNQAQAATAAGDYEGAEAMYSQMQMFAYPGFVPYPYYGGYQTPGAPYFMYPGGAYYDPSTAAMHFGGQPFTVRIHS